jgi:hypothetical protein
LLLSSAVEETKIILACATGVVRRREVGMRRSNVRLMDVYIEILSG